MPKVTDSSGVEWTVKRWWDKSGQRVAELIQAAEAGALTQQYRPEPAAPQPQQ
jgi:hypothetical protein